MRVRRRSSFHERYDLNRSPFAQNPTQRDIAALVHENKEDLKILANPNFKEQFLVRRTIVTGAKQRNLVYPEGRLRAVHERLKFHLNKIIQPDYLMSPRKAKSQRDNALAHLSSLQYLTLDIKQFYPSTTRAMIRNSLVDLFQMNVDVAGLIAHLATADDKACFGSPLTPVLAAIVHRPMFDAINGLCRDADLEQTVWVDDLTISGERISGELVARIRGIISDCGLKSHKFKFRTGNKPVFITGVGVVGSNLVVPSRLEMKSKELWSALQDADTETEKDSAAVRLLAHLGGIRHVVGASSQRGQKISSEMNSIRQKRAKWAKEIDRELTTASANSYPITDLEKEEYRDQIEALPF